MNLFEEHWPLRLAAIFSRTSHTDRHKIGYVRFSIRQVGTRKPRMCKRRQMVSVANK
jgi:hypothetical protein